MDMSAACLPPSLPAINSKDHSHPLFPLYRQHRTFCIAQMIDCPRFDDFVSQTEREQLTINAEKHADYPAFKQWMIDNRGGGRPCPAGAFPNNFAFWRAARGANVCICHYFPSMVAEAIGNARAVIVSRARAVEAERPDMYGVSGEVRS